MDFRLRYRLNGLRLSLVAVPALLAVAGLGGCRHGDKPVTFAAKEFRIKEAGQVIEGGGFNMYANGYLGEYFHSPKGEPLLIRVRAAGDPSGGVYPLARLWVNDELIREFSVDSKQFTDYSFAAKVEPGPVALEIQFCNDSPPGAPEDRNLRVLGVDVTPATRAKTIPDFTGEAIKRHRMGTVSVHAKPGAVIEVAQLSHEFPFGTCLDHRMFEPGAATPVGGFPPADRIRYQKVAAAYFNAGTPENSLKWDFTDPLAPNGPNAGRYAPNDRVVAWARQNGFPLRGHCLFWALEDHVPPWVQLLDDSHLEEALVTRARDVMTRYRGKIDEMDAMNELLHGDYFGGRLGFEINARMFKLAQEANPQAVLYTNDFNVLNGDRATDYIAQIEKLQSFGAPVGGIGFQAHFDQGIDLRHVRRTLKQFDRFNLPLKVTEFDYKTKDEAAKARSMVEFYRTCFANPSVQGITMWGFWAGNMWVPEGALFGRNWAPNPAAKAFYELIHKEWWTQTQVTADKYGNATVPAFYGNYLVRSGGKAVKTALRQKDKTVSVELAR